jgi:vanillate O-demethylase ferredoxin subunit
LLTLRVQAIRYEAHDIRSFELRSPEGARLPPSTAGAHVDIRLPGDLERSYSLLNPDDEPLSYRIAVQRSPRSRGGSAYLFDRLQVGDTVEVVPPSNSFPLHEEAPSSVLIGGGIGITPLWAMIQRLEVLARPWRLYYACRTRPRGAFLEDLALLERAAPGRVVTVFDSEPGQSALSVAQIVASQPVQTHLYCCGPAGMLHAFEQATASRPPETVHTEYFASDQAPAHGGFEVVLARSNQVVFVPVDKTILETLLALGRDVPRSCMSGVCGTCETVVLEGTPDHRDHVLSTRERAANRKMMICCSGSIGKRLVLDL